MLNGRNCARQDVVDDAHRKRETETANGTSERVTEIGSLADLWLIW